MTVLENLEMGAYAAQGPQVGGEAPRTSSGSSSCSPACRSGTAQAGGHDVRRRAADAGHRPGADGAPAAAAARRAVDGPGARADRADLRDHPRDQRAGHDVLLVEQNAAQALQRADRAYVLETGRIVREGAGGELLDDAAVRAAYLGGSVQ